MMRARILLRAIALASDRMLGGAADPLVRAILESCFMAGWLLEAQNAYDTYLGHHRKKWRLIAEEQLNRAIRVNDPEIRQELELFLDPTNAELPAEGDTPPFDQQAEIGGFGNFYSTHRMVTRRAHPDLDSARAGLRGGEGANASPFAPELAEVYVTVGIYLIARLGTRVFERVGWSGAAELNAIAERFDEQARRGTAGVE
jgi:hypothetical protein